MIKTRHIVKGTAATLLAVFGLIMIVWGHARPAPPPSRGGTDSVRAVRLRLNFEGGHWANAGIVPSGTCQSIFPLARSTAASVPHGGGLHRTPARVRKISRRIA